MAAMNEVVRNLESVYFNSLPLEGYFNLLEVVESLNHLFYLSSLIPAEQKT